MTKKQQNSGDHMELLTARDAMAAHYQRVDAEQRPASPIATNIFGVFDNEGQTFLGLVSATQIAQHPMRIFADLVESRHTPCIPEDSALEQLRQYFDRHITMLAVVDDQAEIIGAITLASLLDVLSHSLIAANERVKHHNDSLGAWTDRLQALNTYSQKLLGLLNSTQTPQAILHQASQYLAQIADCPNCLILLTDHDPVISEIIDSGDEDSGIEEGHERTRNTRFEIGQVFCHHDHTKTTQGGESCWPETLTVAIHHQNTILGYIHLCPRINGIPYTTHDHSLVSTYANTLVLILIQANELQRSARLQRDLSISSLLFDCSQEAILITDQNQHIIAINPAFTTITGYPQDAVLGQKPSILSSGHQSQDFYQKMYAALSQQDTWEGEIINRRKSGTLFTEWLKITVVRGNDGQVCNYIASFFDISEIKAINDKVRHLTFYDPLTRLPNRQLSHRKLKESLLQAKHRQSLLAMMFLDIDNFKVINDRYGNAIGDRALQEVANRINDCIRVHNEESDADLISRQGGDEFTMIIQNITTMDEAENIAKRIIHTIHEPMLLQDIHLHITVSIGLSFFPNDAETMEEILCCADSAMYEAKKAGKDCYRVFCRSMADANRRIYRLRADLNDALKKAQLHLVYQPRVSFPKGHIASFEALLRWTHPDFGNIPPDEFIPLLEESLVANDIEDWVLNTAIEQCLAWNQASTHEIGISINITAKQLQDTRFSRYACQVMTDTGLPAHLLEIELTERIAIKNVTNTRLALRTLSDYGIRSSLDDFGTGYSSLSYLTDFDLDIIKIDKSFVNKVQQSKRDRHLVKAILGLGNSLQLHVIAEGVENQAQLDFLRAEGCEEFQGFFFSRPIEAKESLQLLTHPEWASIAFDANTSH